MPDNFDFVNNYKTEQQAVYAVQYFTELGFTVERNGLTVSCRLG